MQNAETDALARRCLAIEETLSALIAELSEGDPAIRQRLNDRVSASLKRMGSPGSAMAAVTQQSIRAKLAKLIG